MIPPIRYIIVRARHLLARTVAAALLASTCPLAVSAAQGLRAEVSFPASLRAEPADGRMLLLVARDSMGEPRFRINDSDDSQQLFGVDVDGLRPGAAAQFDGRVLGYPLESLNDLPAGDYWVQGLLHLYETFRRSDGHVVKLPMDRGEGQQWSRAPGNLYSTPRKVRIDPASGGVVRIALDQVIPPIAPMEDTKYVKYVRLQSELLTKFWGRPMYLGAIVVLPEGWDSHPQARYPMAVYQGHFQETVSGWRETPPEPGLPAVNLDSLSVRCPNGHEGEACTRFGYERLQQEYGYDFFRTWTGAAFPRVIMVTIQHANPYYDDSYAVNSANLGPYGDAITHELIPHLEQLYRGLGQGWARALYGGSTGGWESLAVQMFYPDEYNGAYANCPDPIDFRAYTVIDLYSDRNAYVSEGSGFKRTPRPGTRDYLGQVRTTLEMINRRELVLGTKSRSGDQWAIWEAVYGPVGADGYPKPIWDKRTGEIDREVAEYWREHYDLSHILRRDWATLGPKLQGKLHLAVGDMDNYYLNDAVYLTEQFLEGTTNPPYRGSVRYGDRAEHCWSGDSTQMNFVSRLTYNERFIRQMARHWVSSAPAGADTLSWRY